VIQIFLSDKICEGIKHYVDGVFFGTICTLLSVMMVYKYWDSITKEDLEFSVDGKGNTWEVKELLNEDDEFAPYAGQAANTVGYQGVSFANTGSQYGTASQYGGQGFPQQPQQQQHGFQQQAYAPY
ncbi:Chitin synthase, class 7, partial [Coemansia sp. RSA 2618]